MRAHVFGQTRQGWSLQQISDNLARMSQEDLSQEDPPPSIDRVLHETIDQAIYVLPRGEIRKEIIGFLWQGQKLRQPRPAGNASATGTLVERKSRFTLLARKKNCSADAALSGFQRSLNRVPTPMRATCCTANLRLPGSPRTR